ncbi:unnamed protein product [Calypogeia fissa]
MGQVGTGLLFVPLRLACCSGQPGLLASSSSAVSSNARSSNESSPMCHRNRKAEGRNVSNAFVSLSIRKYLPVPRWPYRNKSSEDTHTEWWTKAVRYRKKCKKMKECITSVVVSNYEKDYLACEGFEQTKAISPRPSLSRVATQRNHACSFLRWAS